MARARAALVVLVLAAATACSTPAATPLSPTAPALSPTAPALEGVFGQGRSQVEERTAKAVLTLPEGAEPVEVTGLELLLPGFTGTGTSRQSTRFEPGRTVALQAPYGRATCQGDPTPHLVRARVTTAGRQQPLTLVLADPGGRAARILARECAAQRVEVLAPLAWQPHWVTEGSGSDLVALGRLQVGPVSGGEPVTVEGLGPTPLFTYDVVGGPVTLAPGEGATLDVRLTPARCDPHAVAEDKLGFAPVAALRVGAEALTVAAWVPRDQRQVPLAALLERCATS